MKENACAVFAQHRLPAFPKHDLCFSFGFAAETSPQLTESWKESFAYLCETLLFHFVKRCIIKRNTLNLANVFVKSLFMDFPIFFWKKGALN